MNKATTAPSVMKGDLAKQREALAKRMGTFKQVRGVGSAFGKSVTPNQTREKDYSKSGSVKVMEHPAQKDISGLRGTGHATVRKHNTTGSGRPEQADTFRTYPMTGKPQGNESPVRGEHND